MLICINVTNLYLPQKKSKASEVTLTCGVLDACVHDIVRVTYLDLFDKCAISKIIFVTEAY